MKEAFRKLLKIHRSTQEAIIRRYFVKRKDFLKKFLKFTKNIFAGVSFLIELLAGNLKLSEVATGDAL